MIHFHGPISLNCPGLGSRPRLASPMAPSASLPVCRPHGRHFLCIPSSSPSVSDSQSITWAGCQLSTTVPEPQPSGIASSQQCLSPQLTASPTEGPFYVGGPSPAQATPASPSKPRAGAKEPPALVLPSTVCWVSQPPGGKTSRKVHRPQGPPSGSPGVSI